MRKLAQRSDCPLSSALDLFGDRWTLLVIRDLMFRGKSTFGELLASEEGIATNILADRLATLSALGFLRKVKPPGRARSAYLLTPKGVDLMPALLELIAWSDRHLAISERGRRLARRFREDRAGVLAAFGERIAASAAALEEPGRAAGGLREPSPSRPARRPGSRGSGSGALAGSSRRRPRRVRRAWRSRRWAGSGGRRPRLKADFWAVLDEASAP